MDYNIDELEWKCVECEVTAPPTSYDYMKLLKHQKGHHIQLVNKVTGEVVAKSPRSAHSKGIELAGAKPGASAFEFTEEGITLPITLPPVVFTLFDVAKAAGRVPQEMDLNSWLVECVQKRYELDYRLKLMLVPIAQNEG